jgi:hypothetical protein
VLRRIFASKGDEITGNYEKLLKQEMGNFYFSPYIMMKSRRMIWAGRVARMGEKRRTCMVLVEIRIPLARPRRRWRILLKYILGK